MKKLLIVGLILVLVGGGMFAGGMAIHGFDWQEISTKEYTTNNREAEGEFNRIEVDIVSADIEFFKSTNNETKIVCFEEVKKAFSVDVSEGLLKITQSRENWKKDWGIGFKSPSVKVFLANTTYDSLYIKLEAGEVEIPSIFSFKTVDVITTVSDIECEARVSESVKIKTGTGEVDLKNCNPNTIEITTNTGEIDISDCRADSVNIKTNTGDVNLENLNTKSINIESTVGNIELEDVLIENELYIQLTTGDVEFENSDAGSIEIKTTVGSVTGNLLSGKNFHVNTNTGRVRVPESTGGECKIVTSTGDVRLTVGRKSS